MKRCLLASSLGLFVASLLWSPWSTASSGSSERTPPETKEKILRHQLASLVSRSVAGWAIIRDYATFKRLTLQLSQIRYTIYNPWGAINYVFGPYAGQANRVSDCESHHNIWARNGQFEGMFQMGKDERRRYGHGNYALAQSRAAYRYFVASGRDWSPWECKP